MELNNHWENTLVTSQKSFIELCELFPEKKFFTFQNGTEYPDFLTGKTLAQKTIILGSVLQQKLVSQEKALLLFTPGLEYIYSLMACLYANIVAIPIPVTDLTQKEQLVEIINNILIDSEATCIITDSNFKELLEMEQVFNSVFVLNVHEQTQDGFANQEARSHAHDDLALLLYTSGSSSLPKGVMLTHNNLISQAAIGAFQWKINKESCVVSWMPHFHNFGLFFGILSPLLQGATSVIQSPDSFVKDPVGWFKVIDQYKTTHTAAPNFAFDYCYSSVDISSVKEISLNSLQVIVCGGEPFSKVTYENFIEKFRGLGIDTNAFCPHYGMSEAGSITTKKTGQPIRFLSLDIRSMEQGKIKHTKQKHDSKSVTSCGEIEEFIKILCVNSETCEPCLPNEVGEIWIKSISVGRGYLKKEKETEYTFSGVLNNTKEGGFFRTGDLGFIEDNHLYIVGRDKDVIIIHGKNHHPVDIEWTIKKYVPYLTLPVSVFSREVNDQEKVVVVQEIEIPLNQTDYKKIAQDILTAVSENHMIELYEINLVKNGSIPRTGSGKIQRKICRDVYINQNIKIIYQYRYGNSESQSCIQGSYVREKCNILDDLIREVFLPELDIKFDRLSSISTFSELGLDSIQYMTISKRIEDVFKIQFTPVMLFKYRNFEKLAQYLSTELEELQIEVIQPTKMKNDIVVDFQDVKKRDIAIIGMDCNFPGGAENLELFWTNLINERDCITPISQSRPQILKDYQYYNGDLNDSFPQWGGFIGDVETFDASFFGISPMEAESMDPQQRKLLELTWRVIENSGYNPNQLGDMDIGLFVGVHNCDYSELVSRHTDAMNTYGAYLDSGLHMSMIANRTSRWFNFHGPSEVINSACSSSLVALHHAVESICRKESSLAIVAGINIILTSRIYRASHKAGMLSKDGRCKTFDQRSNGFVRAEGYGAVLLKPYNQAIKDGNTIYGVIKGAVINHDGQSNSLRAPNLNAQKQLIKSAYQESGISPETISYIETHGTGTSLGDPIEFQALQEAFEEINPKLPKAFCGLGSVKTNIGHCESAAGIAGLIKVLLAMKYQTLPRILHFENLNSYIPLKESPFYIVDQTHKWNRIKDSEGQEIARRAGISSFGYGGANAHVIVEEYIPSDTLQQAAVTESETEMMIVPLSAKNGERLRVYVKQLSEFLKKLKDQNAIHNSENVDLREIAYTLQVGREAMEERVVFLAREIPSLIQRLDEFEQGKEHIENSWQGRAKQGKDFVSLLRSDEETQKLVYLWLNKGMFNKIAQYWALGGTVNWDLLYDQNKPQCISLPTYPFARERYWIPEIKVQSTGSSITTGIPIHPLLHLNTSDLLEQRFSSTFTGEEFFLVDHVIKGQRVLPGVAYLEMARAAVVQATGTLREEQSRVRIKNVVWARPIIVGEQPVHIHIGLYPEDNGEIAYEIYSEAKETGTEPIVYSQGRAVLHTAEEVPTLDIKALQAVCSQGVFSSLQCYEAFRSIGIEYGTGHQGIENIYVGSGQVLAKLCLPSSVSNTQDQFVLHPSIMDSALQASIGLMADLSDLKPVLPFALEEIEIFGNCTPAMWALIRTGEGSKSGDKVQKLDVDILDETGVICVRMKGFSSRVLEGAGVHAGSPERSEVLMLHPCWKEQAAIRENADPDYVQQLVILCEPGEVTRESIETRMKGVHCLILQSGQKEIHKRFEVYTAQIFEKIQSILKDKLKGQVLVQIVVSMQGEQQIFSGLSGLLKTARLENPKLIGQVIEVDFGKDLEEIIEKLKENGRCPLNHWIRYQDDKRWVDGWSEVEDSQEIVRIPWKDQGIYLITGGAGGLGLIFAKEISQRVKGVILILAGRSPLSKDKQVQLKELEALGARVEYRQVDVTRKEESVGLIKSICEDFGGLNGIIHSAGVIRDNFIIKKTKEELQEVIAPKITGLVTLDEASKDLSLDFFIFFSSIAGAIGNPGQVDYATANAFMDAYAKYRNTLVTSKQRYGQTLSVNWPLWKDGGMHVDEETEKLMKQSMGMIAMQTSTGIRALYQSLASGQDQVMVLEGDLALMKQKLLYKINSTILQPKKISAISGFTTRVCTSNILETVQTALLKIVSKLLKIKIEDIDADTELSEYGFDSIALTEFSNKLNQEYKIGLNPAIFFEYPTLHSFAEYLIAEYQNIFMSRFKLSTTKEEVIVLAPKNGVHDEGKESVDNYNKKLRSRFTRALIESTAKPQKSIPEPIAIIGMCGVFPMARDVNEFWRNLKEGRDCITEIPKDRWDWREYYGDPTKEVNKTNIKWGGFIDGVDEFDPLFFGISPCEAELMDPQQRLIMTYIWRVIEDAGYSAQRLSGTKTGIFVGTTSSGYSRLISQTNIAVEAYTSTGMVPSVGPNRMSYFLNIHGCSEPIETACSSSLVAIHRAVSAIENGDCEMAIVGGVNVILTPEMHISFNKAGMLCEDGRCKTFSDQANGYVRGEGVGMIFLKKLKDVEQSGDHIYGIIRGTAENHGGRSNSLTAPNPKAQAEVIRTAYIKAGIDPRTVTYIETHGTGTELGDPIEINGLKTAFKELYQATDGPKVVSTHCGLGSVKSNIGHLELAAGISGVIKVLLQLKHKTLVKTLHCAKINSYIQIEDSPFYIVQETKEWNPLQNIQGEDIPRRAGISSFGFGGSNAHVVIEEYIPENRERPTITTQNPAVIVLSARNEERLREHARQLLVAIREQQFSDESLSDMAYTLQIGREAMEERMGIIVGSIRELEEKLKGYVEGHEEIGDLFRGQVKRNKGALAVFAADEDMAKAIDAWAVKKKYTKLLDLWVKGLVFDWNLLYGDVKPQCISLPTYPFARERYWIPEIKVQSTGSSITTGIPIHPLLHLNTSDLLEQRFSSTFTGEEFFLVDHVIKGQRVLPGVAYLEMARAAVVQATGTLREEQSRVRIKNVVWARPIIVGEQPVHIHIGLYPEDNGEIAYEIYSEAKETGTEPIVYSQGRAVLHTAEEVPTLDIKALQAVCSQGVFSSLQCYEAFRSIGIEYGTGHQGIENIYVGSGQVLAKLCLPSSVSNTQDQFVLHPSIMDSALQASIGLMADLSDLKPVLPFALEEIEIFGNCTPAMWALIRTGEGSKSGDKVQKLDVDILDETGVICVRMKGFSSRVLEGAGVYVG